MQTSNVVVKLAVASLIDLHVFHVMERQYVDVRVPVWSGYAALVSSVIIRSELV